MKKKKQPLSLYNSASRPENHVESRNPDELYEYEYEYKPKPKPKPKVPTKAKHPKPFVEIFPSQIPNPSEM